MCNFCMVKNPTSKYFTFFTHCMALIDHLFLKLFSLTGCSRRGSAEGFCTYSSYNCACVCSSRGRRNGEWGLQREEEDPAYLWSALQRAFAVCGCTAASTRHWCFVISSSFLTCCDQIGIPRVRILCYLTDVYHTHTPSCCGFLGPVIMLLVSQVSAPPCKLTPSMYKHSLFGVWDAFLCFCVIILPLCVSCFSPSMTLPDRRFSSTFPQTEPGPGGAIPARAITEDPQGCTHVHWLFSTLCNMRKVCIWLLHSWKCERLFALAWATLRSLQGGWNSRKKSTQSSLQNGNFHKLRWFSVVITPARGRK